MYDMALYAPTYVSVRFDLYVIIIIIQILNEYYCVIKTNMFIGTSSTEKNPASEG